ncbi:winged helix-turn-helix domain-containing protein [Streptomyces sp. NPDC051366]|uniref:winged helix-turn-helix domain-containing protein n=1 Tax=Streptomyces sp. NPDC051366 TaxID=3365652 RepID=UPI0037BD1666
MLRLHFTGEDLARVRLTLLGPLAETELALRNVQSRDQKALFGNWRAHTGPQVPDDGRDVARFLASPGGGLVDLFTLVGPVGSMDEGIERLRGAPHRRLRAEWSVYPTLRDPIAAAAIWSAAARPRRALASLPQPLTALLGRTRAIVLCAIADHPACTTTQLAAHAGISPASASEHAGILRRAGLTTLTRDRKAVLHTPTHTGLALLDTGQAGRPAEAAGRKARREAERRSEGAPGDPRL